MVVLRTRHEGSLTSESACVRIFVAVLMVAAVTWASPILGNGESVYIDCPCTLSSDENSDLTVSLGLSNYSTIDQGPFRILVSVSSERQLFNEFVAVFELPVRVPRKGNVATASYRGAWYSGTSIPRGHVTIWLADPDSRYHTWVFMDDPIEVRGEFSIRNLDFLKDSDDDGVGDVNEVWQDTDPADPASTPGNTVIDVLAMYTGGFAEVHAGEPLARIQHIFEVSNQILRDSNLAFQWRLVGSVLVEADEKNIVLANSSNLITEGNRHGSDIAVLLGRLPPKRGFCGLAPILGWGNRGFVPLEGAEYLYARVAGDCSSFVSAHEFGHILGLHHSVFQDSTGAWRWSRGHDTENGFTTVMSYGRGGRRINVFSDPDGVCSVPGESVDHPCGVAEHEREAANSVASLEAVRFQFPNIREAFEDTDDDGFVDPVDEFPDDSNEFRDFDGDGIGDTADTDDDGDGVEDAIDAFPLDANEHSDADNDGVGDNSDAFSNDPSEWRDTDNDGVGDNSDLFPNDPNEWADSDLDGVGDNADELPNDIGEWTDTDSDGIGNIKDDDDDNDGVLDSVDFDPLDAHVSEPASYRFIGAHAGQRLNRAHAIVDTQNDRDYILIAAPGTVSDQGDVGAVYVIASDDFASLDAMDGTTDRSINVEHVPNGTNSWMIHGTNSGDRAGSEIASSDVDGNGAPEIVLTAPGTAPSGTENDPPTKYGSVFLIPVEQLGELADEGTHVVDLANVGSASGAWILMGAPGDQIGTGNALSVGDADGDGLDDLLIGAPERHITNDNGDTVKRGAAYFVRGDVLGLADASDGSEDGVIWLELVVSANLVYLIESSTGDFDVGKVVSLQGDSSNDGRADLVIGSSDEFNDTNMGKFSILASSSIADADAEDETVDGNVQIESIPKVDDSWEVFDNTGRENLFGTVLATHTDYTNDSRADIVAGARVHFFESSMLASLDQADGSKDGVIKLDSVASQPGATVTTSLVTSINPIGGDVDGDGSMDFSMNGLSLNGRFWSLVFTGSDIQAVLSGQSTLNNSASMHVSAPKYADFASATSTFVRDIDGDGNSELLISSVLDDTGGKDAGAAYLLYSSDLETLTINREPRESRFIVSDLFGDTDDDGLPNFNDTDDDNDGVEDLSDWFTLDAMDWGDSDGDGVGDNRDAFPNDPLEDTDTDGDGLGDRVADSDDDADGIDDSEDEYPLDTDNDGIENSMDPDDDGDGVPDAEDDFPLDATESLDTDGDGVGNNADADDDNDGVNDESDALPLDATESVDTDGDGVGDNADVFPNDADEWADFDSDGIGDNADPDDDNDGVLDDDDAFPRDADRSLDADGDGVADQDDAFPNDPAEWADSDSDGIGDNTDTDADNDGVGDEFDVFPTNPLRYELTSFKIRVHEHGAAVGHVVGTAGDIDNDGLADLQVSVLYKARETTATYLFAASDLVELDRADGFRDGLIRDVLISEQEKSWKLLPHEDITLINHLGTAGDIDGDDLDEAIVATGTRLLNEAYIVSPSDLANGDLSDGEQDGVVDLEQLYEQPNSWKIEGPWASGFGTATSLIDDVNADSIEDLVFAAPGRGFGNDPGTVYVLPTSELSALDELNEAELGVISWPDDGVRSSNKVWELTGETGVDAAGTHVGIHDFNNDTLSDVAIGARRHDLVKLNEGAVYLLSHDQLTTADGADGVVDRKVELVHAPSLASSWKFHGGRPRLGLGTRVGWTNSEDSTTGYLLMTTQRSDLYMVSEADFVTLDAQDGATDGIANMSNIQSGSGSWTIGSPWSSPQVALLDDFVDQSGALFIGRPKVSCTDRTLGILLVVSEEEFSNADRADGTSDRVIEYSSIAARSTAWHFMFASDDEACNELIGVSSIGDIDGDTLQDIALQVGRNSNDVRNTISVYAISQGDFPILDEMDGTIDRRIDLFQITKRERYTLPAETEE